MVVYSGELLLWGHPVWNGVKEIRSDLLLQPCDPDHEEFIEVGLGDRHEPHPLQQRVPLVAGLFENPVVEPQPRELPVYVQRRVGKARPTCYVSHISLSSASNVPSLTPTRVTVRSCLPKRSQPNPSATVMRREISHRP